MTRLSQMSCSRSSGLSFASQIQFAKLFFFLHAYKKDRNESRELPWGPFTSAEGQGEGCLPGALLLARQGAGRNA